MDFIYVFNWMCCFPRLVEEFDMVAGFIEYCFNFRQTDLFPMDSPKI